jgi:hypothetical protein
MHARVSTSTPYRIDLAWWEERGRNLRRYLAEILGDNEQAESVGQEPLDYIDPATAEVVQLDPLWVMVLIRRAHKADYITPSTPLTNAVLRALIENVNEPMTVVQLQRRINRGTPESLLRMMPSVRSEYGIVPVTE